MMTPNDPSRYYMISVSFTSTLFRVDPYIRDASSYVYYSISLCFDV